MKILSLFIFALSSFSSFALTESEKNEVRETSMFAMGYEKGYLFTYEINKKNPPKGKAELFPLGVTEFNKAAQNKELNSVSDGCGKGLIKAYFEIFAEIEKVQFGKLVDEVCNKRLNQYINDILKQASQK